MSFWDGVQRFAKTSPPAAWRLDHKGHRIPDDDEATATRQAEAIARLAGTPEKPRKRRSG